MAQLYSSAKKRDLPNYQSQQRYTQPPPGLQNTRDNWNPKVWEWNSVRFVAKPKEAEELLRLGTTTPTHIHIPIKGWHRAELGPRRSLVLGDELDDDDAMA